MSKKLRISGNDKSLFPFRATEKEWILEGSPEEAVP